MRAPVARGGEAPSPQTRFAEMHAGMDQGPPQQVPDDCSGRSSHADLDEILGDICWGQGSVPLTSSEPCMTQVLITIVRTHHMAAHDF